MSKRALRILSQGFILVLHSFFYVTYKKCDIMGVKLVFIPPSLMIHQNRIFIRIRVVSFPRTVQYIIYVTAYVSIYTLVLMAADRYESLIGSKPKKTFKSLYRPWYMFWSAAIPVIVRGNSGQHKPWAETNMIICPFLCTRCYRV